MVTRPLRIERWKNNGSTTLSAAASITDTTISVTSAANLPTSGDFRLVIDGTEEVTVKSISGTTCTLTAGLAASYVGGETVELVATDDGLERAFQDAFGITDYPFNRILNEGVTTTASGFTWLNQGTATATDADDGGLILECPNEAGRQYRGKYLTAPATPWTVTAYCQFGMMVADFVDSATGTVIGIFMRESSTGKLYVAGIDAAAVRVLKMTDPSTYSADLGTAYNFRGNSLWIQMEDNGTNVVFRHSSNGVDWFDNDFTEVNTTFMSGGPDQVGFIMSSGNASEPRAYFKTFIVE